MSQFGPAYEATVDRDRLKRQMEVVRDVMVSAAQANTWLSLREIGALTHFPEASISADLRHLRKKNFGGYSVCKRRRGKAINGVWEYFVEIHKAEAPRQEILPL